MTIYVIMWQNIQLVNHLSYEKFSEKHKAFLLKISENKDPKNYIQASKQTNTLTRSHENWNQCLKT